MEINRLKQTSEYTPDLAIKAERILSLTCGNAVFQDGDGTVSIQKVFNIETGTHSDTITFLSRENLMVLNVVRKSFGDKVLLSSTISLNGENGAISERIYKYANQKLDVVTMLAEQKRRDMNRQSAIRRGVYAQISSQTTQQQLGSILRQLSAIPA